MAVLKMKKLRLTMLRKHRDELLGELICRGCVELIKPEELENLVKAGGFQQSVHVMAWLLAKEADRDGKA